MFLVNVTYFIIPATPPVEMDSDAVICEVVFHDLCDAPIVYAVLRVEIYVHEIQDLGGLLSHLLFHFCLREIIVNSYSHTLHRELIVTGCTLQLGLGCFFFDWVLEPLL
jgi:hypothetical protein